MKKLLLAGLFMLFASSQANASFIDLIEADDLAGIEVTVEFFDGQGGTFFSPVIAWAATGASSGAANGSGWSLSMTGPTFGEFNPNTQMVEGAWLFTNDTAFDVASIFINAIVAGIVFDPMVGDNGDGTGNGRPLEFNSQVGFVGVGTWGPEVLPGVYGSLTIDLLGDLLVVANGGALEFVVDTDAVPAPATIALLAGALGFAGFARRKRLI